MVHSDNSIEKGYDHIETLKRYTGAFKGPRLGKTRAANVLKLFAARTGQAAEDLRVPTMRPPVEPIPLGWLAAAGEEDQDA